jgi:plasmid stability protein
MATLYVENVPDQLYDALRTRARHNRTSIAAEVVKLLEQHIPTAKELARRKALIERAIRLRSRAAPAAGPFPSAEEMVREDRNR